MCPQFVDEFAKRSTFLLQPPPKCARTYPEAFRDQIEAHGSPQGRKKDFPNPAGQTRAQLQLAQQSVAELGDLGIRHLVSEIRSAIQPFGIEDKLVFGLSVEYRATKDLNILFGAARPAECEMKLCWAEQLSHDIAMKRYVNAGLQLDDEFVQLRIHLRIRNRDHSPCGQLALL